VNTKTTSKAKLRLASRLTTTLALSVLLMAAVPVHGQEAPRIVALGEVQGAANTVAALLQGLGLIDDGGHWTGGDTVLIQTGDLIDGGENSRAAMDLFMRLQEEAATAGGEVIVLMGNHEAMNILGELRDVNYMAYATFAGPDAESRQKAYYDDVVAWRTDRALATGTQFEPDGDFSADWFALHPPGWVEYVEAMGPEGVYGRWLRSLPVAVEIDGVLFIHAGISPEMKGMSVEAINTRADDEIRRFDEDREIMVAAGLCLPLCGARDMVEILKEEVDYLNTLDPSQRTADNPRMKRAVELQHLGQWGTWSILTDAGPLWFKGTSLWDEKERSDEMGEILDASGFNRMVTGQSGGKERVITARFGDRVVLTSVDLSDNPWDGGGTPAALEIVEGDYFVATTNGRELLIDPR